MDIITENSWQPKKTATEYWLETFPTTEVRMNEAGHFVDEGKILVTNGFNGCTALIVRAELPDGKVRGFLAHKHADPNGRSLSEEAEKLQQQLQQRLRARFGEQWQQLRSARYAIYEGFPGSVNSNRLVYNVAANMWLHREGANDQEHPLSGLLKWDNK